MRKNAKRHSLGKRFLNACLTAVSRLALAAGDVVARNPVVAGGATAFLVTLGFVASNAIWYQPEAHDGVFFKTRPEQVFRASDGEGNTNKRLTGTTTHHPQVNTGRFGATQATLPNTTVDGGDLPALAPNGDKDVGIMQYNLKQLGFYDGSVDGLTGPQTRKALEQWQNVQAKLTPAPVSSATTASIGVPENKPASAARPDHMSIAEVISAVVPESKPENMKPRTIPLIEKAPPIFVKTQEKTAAAPIRNSALTQPSPKQPLSGQTVSAEELVRIQAGLKAFGNDMVVVDGVPGKSTEEAIREFQKLFRLNVSGQPDPELIGKMREIGLIG